MALLKTRLHFFVYVQCCPSTHQVQWLFKLTVLHLVRLYHINFGVMYMFSSVFTQVHVMFCALKAQHTSYSLCNNRY